MKHKPFILSLELKRNDPYGFVSYEKQDQAIRQRHTFPLAAENNQTAMFY
jgi:hypothetical protein